MAKPQPTTDIIIEMEVRSPAEPLPTTPSRCADLIHVLAAILVRLDNERRQRLQSAATPDSATPDPNA